MSKRFRFMVKRGPQPKGWIDDFINILKDQPIDPSRVYLWQQLKNKPMSYTKVFAVPDPLGVHHFDDFDSALEFAQSKGLSPGRILTEYLDEGGNPINAPQGEVDEDQIARQEALRIAQDEIQEAARIAQDELDQGPIAKASAPSEFIQPLEVTPQDLGIPSPVPYSVFMRRPSADIDPTGLETRQETRSAKRLETISQAADDFCPGVGLGDFIRSAFDAGAYRLEIIVGDCSIKVYKHPNN